MGFEKIRGKMKDGEGKMKDGEGAADKKVWKEKKKE